MSRSSILPRAAGKIQSVRFGRADTRSYPETYSRLSTSVLLLTAQDRFLYSRVPQTYVANMCETQVWGGRGGRQMVYKIVARPQLAFQCWGRNRDLRNLRGSSLDKCRAGEFDVGRTVSSMTPDPLTVVLRSRAGLVIAAGLHHPP